MSFLGYVQRWQPARLTRRTCRPIFLVTATVPRGAPSRRCTLAASSQTSSSAERRPAHPDELVWLAHCYRCIVGRPPSLRPPGKRCGLVSLIFCLFSPWAGAKKCREAAHQQAETGGKFPQCIPTTRDESAVRAADTHQNCQMTSALGRSAGHMQRSQPIRCVCRGCPK